MREKIKISKNCPHCGKEQLLEVYKDDFKKFQDGELVQKCFPYLTPEDREMLITGICPHCWDEIFN